MENSNKCALCCKIDVLQSYDFRKQIQTSFFSVNKKHFPEDFVKDINLCVICAQKIQFSTCIKKDYDEMCNRNNRITNLKCFFCEQKTYLTNLDDNPNETHRKIDVFLNAVIIRHEWKQFKACLKCLYNLDVWFEVRNSLYTIKNIPTTIAENELAHNNNNRSLSQHRSQRKVLTKLNLEKPTITNTKKNKARPRSRQTNKNQVHWNKYLNERFSKFQTVNKSLNNGNLCAIITEVNIKDNDKLFNKLPFVEIFLNSQINTRKEDIILISDTETEAVRAKRSTRKRKLNLSLTSLFSLKSNEESPIQTNVRSSSSTSRRKPAPKEDFNDKNSIESNSECSTEVIDSSSEEQENLVCSVCDKCFTVRCEYLQHRLKHEKFETLVVKVVRDNLPQKLDVSKLANTQSPSSSVNINALLSKWVGENAVEEYQECSKNCDSNIDTKIDKDSEQNEEEDEIQTDVSADKLKETSEERQSNEAAEPIGNDKENNVNDTEEISDEDKEDDVSDVAAKKCGNKNDSVTDNSDEAINISDQEKNDDEKQGEEIEKDDDKNEKEEEEIEKDDKNEKEEEIEKDDDKYEKEDQAISDEELSEQENEEKESDEDKDEEESSLKRDEESQKSLKEKEDNDENEITETVFDLDKITTIENNDKIVSSESKNTKSSVDTEEFSNGSSDPDPVMSCDDLLNILNDDDTKSGEDSKKRKHESIDEEGTPKRKRVRFAEEKEIYTPDKVVTLEKIIETDQFSQEETETDKNGDSET